MTAPPATDPALAPAARTGSWRPRGALVVLVAGVVLAALVRGFLVESYHVPSGAQAPSFEPGDRVLVLKTDRTAEVGDTALVEDADGALRLVPSADAARSGGEVVGSLVWRFWPLDRLGSVTGVAPVAP